MKKVLSLLMAFVFLQAQSYALSGGPDYGSPANLNVVGTYAGVLVPESVTDESEDVGQVVQSAANIGLFSLGVPDSGPSVGSAIVFVEGTAFNGAIIGVVDPGTGSFRAIIDAVSTYTIIDTVVTGVDANGNPIVEVVESNIFAQGSIDAQIVALGVPSPLGVTPPGSTRVIGTAAIDIFGSLEEDGTPDVTSTATFTVDGFKQSDTATTVTDLTFGTNADPSGDNN
jgi:hypothetical protein